MDATTWHRPPTARSDRRWRAARRWVTRSTSSTPPCGTAPSARASPTRWRTRSPSPRCWTNSASDSSRAAGRGPCPRTPSSSPGRRPVSWICAPRRWSPSAPPARPVSGPRTTRRCGRCSIPVRQVITLVAKSDVRHVERALRTTPEENLAMVSDTVQLLVDNGRRVFLDCEHFFDGYLFDRDYGVRVQEAAVKAGADVVVMCDTNGGMLPMSVERIVGEVRDRTGFPARHPLPGRHQLRRCQHRRRGPGRRHPRAVHRQRLRRTGRQCRPVRRRRQPDDQDGAAGASGGRAGRHDAGLACAGRAGQHHPEHPPGLRRLVRVLAQGGIARLRDQGRSRALQPPGPDPGRQRHAHPDHRDGRSGLGGAQGPRAGRRPVRPPGGGRPDRRHRQGQRGGRLVLRGGRRVIRTAGP